MWEFSVYLQPNEKLIADKIFSQLSKSCKEYNIIITNNSSPNQICLSIACEKFEKPRVVFYIADCLTEIICIDYKERFLNEKLRVKNKDELNIIALKNALINFDKETDKYIVGKNLEIKKTINLSSFFNFKLKYLQEKWMELVRISNENTDILSSNDTIIELLKFLIDNIEINKDVVNVIYDGSNFKIYDNSFNELEIIKTEGMTEEGLIITNLINYCPRRLILYIDDKETNLIELIKQIFFNRITILPNKIINKKINTYNN